MKCRNPTVIRLARRGSSSQSMVPKSSLPRPNLAPPCLQALRLPSRSRSRAQSKWRIRRRRSPETAPGRRRRPPPWRRRASRGQRVAGVERRTDQPRPRAARRVARFNVATTALTPRLGANLSRRHRFQGVGDLVGYVGALHSSEHGENKLICLRSKFGMSVKEAPEHDAPLSVGRDLPGSCRAPRHGPSQRWYASTARRCRRRRGRRRVRRPGTAAQPDHRSRSVRGAHQRGRWTAPGRPRRPRCPRLESERRSRRQPRSPTGPRPHRWSPW